MIYQMVPFSMTLNDSKPDFKVMPFFNTEYMEAKDTDLPNGNEMCFWYQKHLVCADNLYCTNLN